MNKLYIIKQNYELYKSLKSNEIKEYITDNIPHTSKIILDALLNNVILELSKIIVDNSEHKGNENICVKNFLKKYDENKQIYKEKKYYYATEINTNKKHKIKLDSKSCDNIIKEYKMIEKNNQNLIEYLKVRRNKNIAHNDKRFGFDTKNKYGKKTPTYDELDKFINDVYNVVNDLNISVFGITTVVLFNFKTELNWLKELIKSEIK